jgi:hypothetical protein
MLELGPMKNNLNLKFGGNMGAMVWSSTIDEKTQKIESSLKFKRNPKYCNSTWGLDSRGLENNKSNFKNKTNTPHCNSNTCLNNEKVEETLHYINFKAFVITNFNCHLHNQPKIRIASSTIGIGISFNCDKFQWCDLFYQKLIQMNNDLVEIILTIVLVVVLIFGVVYMGL